LMRAESRQSSAGIKNDPSHSGRAEQAVDDRSVPFLPSWLYSRLASGQRLPSMSLDETS
jgi:hypothetical protein